MVHCLRTTNSGAVAWTRVVGNRAFLIAEKVGILLRNKVKLILINISKGQLFPEGRERTFH